jgi:hypothetical protein
MCTIDDPTNSPFEHVRSREYGSPVTKILLKLFPIGNGSTGQLIVSGRLPHGIIELATIDGVKREIDIQNEIYNKSLNTTTNCLDPICPSIITARNSSKRRIFDLLNSKLIFPNPNPNPRRLILESLGLSGSQQHLVSSITFIAMEMMDGYENADVVLRRQTDPARIDFLTSMARYELDRFHILGYLHSDFHFGNFMINENYLYLTNDNTSDMKGRVLLIDFGRTRELTPQEKSRDLNYLHSLEIERHSAARLIQYPTSGIYNYVDMRTQRDRITRMMRVDIIQYIKTRYPGENLVTFMDHITRAVNNRGIRGGVRVFKGGEGETLLSNTTQNGIIH